MIDFPSRKTPVPATGPTGPIRPENPSDHHQVESYKYGNKPTKEYLYNVDVPDMLEPVNRWGEKKFRKNVFDAELNRDTKTLTLHVRIKFDFVDMFKTVHYKEVDGVVGIPYFVDLKEPVRWDAFKKRKETFIYEFARIIEMMWNYRFKLNPTTYCADPVKTYQTAYKILPVVENEHHRCEAHLSKDVELGWDNPFGKEMPQSFIHAHYDPSTKTLKLSEDDLKASHNNKNEFNTKQFYGNYYYAAAHEFGHAMGLIHVNERAVRSGSGTNPYGDTVEQKSHIMGTGGLVSSQDMYPFLFVIEKYTGCIWEPK